MPEYRACDVPGPKSRKAAQIPKGGLPVLQFLRQVLKSNVANPATVSLV